MDVDINGTDIDLGDYIRTYYEMRRSHRESMPYYEMYRDDMSDDQYQAVLKLEDTFSKLEASMIDDIISLSQEPLISDDE